MCYRILGDIDDAEDAFAAALLVAWHKRSTFRDDSSWSTWLIGICRNTSLEILRKRNRDQERSERLRANTIDLDLGEIESEVADRDRVARALGQLTLEFRTAVVLREWGELTYEEIAAAEDIPINTAKSRVSRARKQLRGLLS